MELRFAEWHAAPFILAVVMHVGDILVLEGIRKICIFFMLWGLTRAMIKMFVEKERGVDRILQNVPLGQLKKGKTVFSSPVLSEL